MHITLQVGIVQVQFSVQNYALGWLIILFCVIYVVADLEVIDAFRRYLIFVAEVASTRRLCPPLPDPPTETAGWSKKLYLILSAIFS